MCNDNQMKRLPRRSDVSFARSRNTLTTEVRGVLHTATQSQVESRPNRLEKEVANTGTEVRKKATLWRCDGNTLAPATQVPDTGLRSQAFSRVSSRENWRVLSLDPGLAA